MFILLDRGANSLAALDFTWRKNATTDERDTNTERTESSASDLVQSATVTERGVAVENMKNTRL